LSGDHHSLYPVDACASFDQTRRRQEVRTFSVLENRIQVAELTGKIVAAVSHVTHGDDRLALASSQSVADVPLFFGNRRVSYGYVCDEANAAEVDWLVFQQWLAYFE
jgi:hypothetical protein